MILSKLFYYLSWVLQRSLLKEKNPINGTLIVNDVCSLDCLHCNVSNIGIGNIPFRQLKADITTLYKKNCRILVITGGEPFLWEDRDGSNELNDIVAYAKETGFFRIIICTNGLQKLNTNADILWVSLDGDETSHQVMRGDTYSRIKSNIELSSHRKIYVNFTITQCNYKSLKTASEAILNIKNVKGILYHFFTPYRNLQQIGVSREEKIRVSGDIKHLRKKYKGQVLNSEPGLHALVHGNWERKNLESITICQGQISSCCCRSTICDDATCRECGCASAVESSLIANFELPAILNAMRYF